MRKPSLSFLIQHIDTVGRTTRIVFDLGIRRELRDYPPPLQQHLLTRLPLTTRPDVRDSIERGALSVQDIDVVILSHVHWDHVGTPTDFSKSQFVVGNGALGVLRSGGVTHSGKAGHSHFEPNLLPSKRTFELPPIQASEGVESSAFDAQSVGERLVKAKWRKVLHFPAAIDVFGDESLFIVNAPGHLEGHVNLLARLGQKQWVYLAGDACHDRRLLTGECAIAEWQAASGATCCIHVNKADVERTIADIRQLITHHADEVEVILAHDADWMDKLDNRDKFWPGKI